MAPMLGLVAALAATAATPTVAAPGPAAPATRRLVADGHFLKLQGPDTPTDDEPFVYRGDTAWNFLLRANATEAAEYFEQRGRQGFNAVQAVATGMGMGGFEPMEWGPQADRNGEFAWLDHDGKRVPSPPMINHSFHGNASRTFDVTKHNPAFWAHIDEILDVAAAHGFFVALWATWGSSFISKGGGQYSFHLFSEPEQGFAHGRFIGRRFGARPNLIFVLGGDIALPVDPAPQVAIYRAMAEGLAQGVAEGPSGSRPAHRPKWHDDSDALWRNQLMTLHPTSGLSSSSVFGDDAWLSINMIQAGWKNQASTGSPLT